MFTAWANVIIAEHFQYGNHRLCNASIMIRILTDCLEVWGIHLLSTKAWHVLNTLIVSLIILYGIRVSLHYKW